MSGVTICRAGSEQKERDETIATSGSCDGPVRARPSCTPWDACGMMLKRKATTVQVRRGLTA